MIGRHYREIWHIKKPDGEDLILEDDPYNYESDYREHSLIVNFDGNGRFKPLREFLWTIKTHDISLNAIQGFLLSLEYYTTNTCPFESI